ncbi:hypothetical protein G7Z17_g4232 [Cylindrodendrum hubeiense]|uniref:Uncharacterized protein n=1 Tax=Cylindrodendrum hubeiense TaxID=595255 RepID=A0A9P5LA47_9HYPO|nr:hypothetical protein G7Z17_g4232 [Cylindrodendrum hubeiense]
MCPAHPRQGSADRAWPNLATPLYRLDKGDEQAGRGTLADTTNRLRSQVPAKSISWPCPRPWTSCPTSASGAGNLVLPVQSSPQRRRERSAKAQRAGSYGSEEPE